MTTDEMTIFCARQIECILRYVQNVYPELDGLIDHLAKSVVLLEEVAHK